MRQKNPIIPAAQNFGLALASRSLTEPLHARVRHILRGHILSDFEHGQRFYSERDLIKSLKVSQPTVRRALSDLASEGYLMADPRRGFFVQHHAEVRYVGLITTVMESAKGLGETYAEYAEVCAKAGYSMVVHPLYRGTTIEEVVQGIRHKPSEERIIITGMTIEITAELGAHLQEAGYRCLVVGARPAGFTGSSLSLDHHSEVSQVLDHLSGLGHERITFIVNEPRILLLTSRRAEAVRRIIEQRGLKHAELVYCDTRNWGDSYTAALNKTREILRRKNRPTAIVPLSGAGSWAAFRCAWEEHIDVPGQLSIMSFDQMTHSEMLPVPMTELEISHAQRATKALEILWSEEPDSIHMAITPKLVVRASTGVCA